MSDLPSMLLVDDDVVLRERLAVALRERGYDVHTAANVEDALAKARVESPELAVVDLKMPGRSGLDLVKELKAMDESTRIVVLTGYGSIATALEAVRMGAAHYLQKPVNADELLAAFTQGEGGQSTDATDLRAPSLARAEWEHINRVLADCAGNISEAARRLRIHRRSLQRKLNKHPPRS